MAQGAAEYAELLNCETPGCIEAGRNLTDEPSADTPNYCDYHHTTNQN